MQLQFKMSSMEKCIKLPSAVTFSSSHDALHEEVEWAQAHLHEQLIAMVQADAQGKVPFYGPILPSLNGAQALVRHTL